MKLNDVLGLIRIPAYSPELNPAEKIWHKIKAYFRNKFFDTLEEFRLWIQQQILGLTKDSIKSITKTKTYNTPFMKIFQC